MIDLNDVIDKETIEQWIDVQATLKAAKEEEMELRKEICLALQKSEEGYGTKSFHVQGFDLKTTFDLSYKLDEALYWERAKSMTDEELDCIKLKPTLDVKKFKEISSATLSDLVYVTESAPTLAVK